MPTGRKIYIPAYHTEEAWRQQPHGIRSVRTASLEPQCGKDTALELTTESDSEAARSAAASTQRVKPYDPNGSADDRQESQRAYGDHTMRLRQGFEQRSFLLDQKMTWTDWLRAREDPDYKIDDFF